MNISNEAFIASLIFVSGAAALCDSAGYGEIKQIQFETDDLRIVHWHDWATKKNREARWSMISTDKNPFTESNTYSYIQVFDKKSGNVLFKAPVPALTVVWASPDSKIIIGISKIKLWNPYQLVVFNRSGDLLYKAAINTKSYPGASESVTNWINWYKEPVPNITLQATNDSLEVTIESNNVWQEVTVKGETNLEERPNPIPTRIFRIPIKGNRIDRPKPVVQADPAAPAH